MSRAEDISSFLEAAGWNNCQTENMEADFSTRRFSRLHRDDGQTAVLMDADTDQKTTEFVVIAWLLRTYNLSSPEIFAEQRDKGLVLMEDFGEGNIGRLMDNGCYANETFYERASMVLAQLFRTFEITTTSDLRLPQFNAALFTKQAEKFLDGYYPYKFGKPVREEERKRFRSIWYEQLKPVDKLPQTLMMRDFMPDNVMDLPERKSWRSFGLLDFQDSGIGPIAYDIASFCEVVRRDGGDKYLETMVTQYHERARTTCKIEDLQNGCKVLSAQRHVRILGILGAIAQKDPKSDKLAYLPRVEKYVTTLMKDDCMKYVRDWMTPMGLFI